MTTASMPAQSPPASTCCSAAKPTTSTTTCAARRDGLPEIDWASFEEDVWGNFGYRAPRLRRDLGFLYFRRAAMGLATGATCVRVPGLLLAALLNPTLVAKRLTAQMRHRKRK